MSDPNTQLPDEEVRNIVDESLGQVAEVLGMVKAAEARIAAQDQELTGVRNELSGVRAKLAEANGRVIELEKVRLEKIASANNAPRNVFSENAIIETVAALQSANLCSPDFAVKMAGSLRSDPSYALDVLQHLSANLSTNAPTVGRSVKRASALPVNAQASDKEDWSEMVRKGA